MQPAELLRQCEASPITAWAEGYSELSTDPWVVYINLTNLCNNRCRVCAHPTAMRSERGLMDPELFKRVVEGLPSGVRKVYLQKQGEPLLHPRLEELVAFLRSQRPDIHIAFHTNGIIAKPDRMKNILPLMDSLGVSISAISADTYRHSHGTSAFEAVMRNLAGMDRILEAMVPEHRPHVFIDYISQCANEHESEKEVVDFFRRRFPHLTSVDIHWVYNFQGEIEEGNLDIYKRLPEDRFPVCVFPWSSFTVCHDGKVSYCFVEPRENLFLGDMTKSSFADIWNGEPYQRLRRYMVQHRFSDLTKMGCYCHLCSWLWSMRSQSPRNLAGGYALQPGSKKVHPKLGDILDWQEEKILAVAASAYQQGEVLEALSFCDLLIRSNTDDETRWAARRMLRLCDKVLERYKDAPVWRSIMDEEGASYNDRECRYYGAGDEHVS